MTTCYRIYTERKENIENIVNKYCDAYTVIFANGVWDGNREYSVIVEILGSPGWSLIKDIAREIKQVNSQEAVLITEHPIAIHLL